MANQKKLQEQNEQFNKSEDGSLIVFESDELEGDLKYGQIRYCSLDGGNGNLKKTRPCIIIQINEYNEHANRVCVVPISSQMENADDDFEDTLGIVMNYAYRDFRPSFVCVDRTVFIDKKDIGAVLGNAPAELMTAIKEMLLSRLDAINKGKRSYDDV